MPAIIGAFKVVSNSNGGIVITGDLFTASPTTSSKTYAGAGSFQTGDLPVTNTLINNTIVNDPDVIDSSANKVATAT